MINGIDAKEKINITSRFTSFASLTGLAEARR